MPLPLKAQPIAVPSDAEEEELGGSPSQHGDVPSDDGQLHSSGDEAPQVLKFLTDLQGYLTSRVGKGRSEKEARQIRAVTERFLEYAGGRLANLISPHHLTGYMVHLEEGGGGGGGGLAASSQAATLNRLKSKQKPSMRAPCRRRARTSQG